MPETRPIAAALSILIAMVVISYIDNYVVVIAETGGLWQFHAIRTLMSIPFMLAMVVLGLGVLRPVRFAAVAGRGFVIATAMMIYFGCLAFLPIAEVAAGLFSAPIWVLLISVFAMGERIGPVRIVAVIVGFAGVLLVLRPDTGELTVLSLIPLSAGFFYALGAIATRAWCAGENTLSLLAGGFLALGIFGAAGLAVLAVVAPEVPPGAEGFILRGWVTPTGRFLFWTFVQAVGSLLAVWFITRGYQLAEASFVSLFEYSLLIFVSIWAYILRGEALDVFAALGIALIIGSGVAIALRGRG